MTLISVMLRFDFTTLLIQDATYTRNAYNVQKRAKYSKYLSHYLVDKTNFYLDSISLVIVQIVQNILSKNIKSHKTSAVYLLRSFVYIQLN